MRAEAGQRDGWEGWDGWDVRQIGLLVLAARLWTPRHGSKDAFFSREATESDWARRKAVKLSGPDRLGRCGSGVRSMTRRRHGLGIMFGLDERDNASSGWGNCGCGSGGGNLRGDGGVWIGQG